MENLNLYISIFIILLAQYGFILAGRVQRLGNDIVLSTSGTGQSHKGYILNDRVQSEGVVFAYSAYFVRESPMRFQIWRRINTGSNRFTLVGETRVEPTVLNGRQDIYLANNLGKCIKVKSGDRLGLFFEVSPGAVAYTLNQSDPIRLAYEAETSTIVGEDVTFDTENHSYKFSASAFIDTEFETYADGSGESSVSNCPSGLDIYGSDRVWTTMKSKTDKPQSSGSRSCSFLPSWIWITVILIYQQLQ